jgi:predicted metal-dependent phosphoesterase TrpH
MIDLHSHTTASDGQHTPEELLQLAADAGVTTLAVTDHDTVAGLEACEVAARAHRIRLVPGIEVSAFVGRKEVHILGHFVDRTEARLGHFAGILRTEREKRMVQMVAKMKGLGFPVTMDHVRAIAGDAHLGRPHLARVLVEGHWCTSTKEAFDRFLGDGKPAAVPRFEVTIEEAIALIRGANGTATLAHPGVSKVLLFELEAMKRAGLSGIEAEHSDHPPTLRQKFLGWAADLDLIPTSGSDFHGKKVAPDRHLGTASMKPELLAALEARRPTSR